MVSNDFVNQLVQLVATGNYLGVAVLVVGLLQVWLSSASAFPATLPTKWIPVVSVVLGQVYSVLLIIASHQPVASAIVHGVIASVLALLTSHAIWSGDGPAWVRILAMLLQATGKQQAPKFKIEQKFGDVQLPPKF